MRLLAAALAGLALLSTPSGAVHRDAIQAAEADLVVAGLSFPQNIGKFVRGNTRDFESDNPGLGSSVAYHRPGVTTTVYVYDRQLTNIPDGPRSNPVRTELDSALEEIAELVRRGNYQSWKPRQTGEFRSASPGSGFRFAVLTIRRDGRVTDSYVFVTALAGKFVKVRITAAAGTFGLEDAKRFVTALAKALVRRPGAIRAGLDRSPRRLDGLILAGGHEPSIR